MKHIVAISGGKDSTAMALRLAEIKENEYEYIFTPTGNELPELFEHLTRIQDILKTEIKNISPGCDLIGLSREMNAIPNWRMRFCTRILKIEPYQQYVRKNLPICSYVGLRADEDGRAGLEWDNEPRYKSVYPLREWNWGISEVVGYLNRKKITIPRRTDCALCFFQSLYEWYLLDKEYPDLYQQGVDLEKEIGYTFRSETKDNWPGALDCLRKEFKSGRIPVQRKRKMKCRICAK